MIATFIGSLLIFIGSLFLLVAAIGILKLSDLLLQMHAATKAGTLGAGLVLLGVGIQLKNFYGIVEILLLIFFIALTGPIAAHVIAKTAYHNKDLDLDPRTKIDE